MSYMNPIDLSQGAIEDIFEEQVMLFTKFGIKKARGIINDRKKYLL